MFISHEDLTLTNKQKCIHHILLCGTSVNICIAQGKSTNGDSIEKILESYESQ